MEKNNSNDIDLFVNMLNKNDDPYHIEQEVKHRQEQREEAIKYYENTLNNTYNPSEPEKTSNKTNKKGKSPVKRFIALVTASAMIAGAGYGVKKVSDKVKIKKTTASIVSMAEDSLVEHNLGTKENGTFVIGNNTVEDYSVLEADTPMEVWIYRFAIDNNEEFEKFIQSVSYDNGLYTYTDIAQFLRINGYYDEKGTPSYVVFSNYMEAAIENAINNNTLSQYQDEYSITYDLPEESHKTR